MTVFIKNVSLDDVHSVLKLLYAPMFTHNVIAKKGIKPNLWPLITREPGVRLKRKLVYTIGHTHRARSYIKILTNFFFFAPYLPKWAYFSFLPISDLEWPWMTWRFLSKMFPSMMCTMSWNCYMLQCTHTMLLLKRYQTQPLIPYNSRTGCPIEAEVGLLHRAHRALSYIKILTNFFFFAPYLLKWAFFF